MVACLRREGGREGERKGRKEGQRKGRREGQRKGRREGQRKGRRERQREELNVYLTFVERIFPLSWRLYTVLT